MSDVKERKHIIGGSDMGDLFSLPPYGCQRKLYYRFSGVQIDYDNPAMARGRDLEDFILFKTKKMFPELKIRKHKDPFIKIFDNFPEYQLKAHVDFLFSSLQGKGVGEIKTAGTVFTKLPDAYWLQGQFYLWLTNRDILLYPVLFINEWEFKFFWVKRDEDLIEKIKEEVLLFFEDYSKGVIPHKLLYTDNRCKTCPFREKCWGEGIIPAHNNYLQLTDEGVINAVEEYEKAKEIRKEADKLEKGAKEVIINFILENNANGVIDHRNGILYTLEEVTRESIDTKKLKLEYPDVYEKVKKQSKYLKLNSKKISEKMLDK